MTYVIGLLNPTFILGSPTTNAWLLIRAPPFIVRL
nr:MAG TPA: hypothetical protein [Caudoviricetes sp.]